MTSDFAGAAVFSGESTVVSKASDPAGRDLGKGRSSHPADLHKLGPYVASKRIIFWFLGWFQSPM
jgi:hypothetical protein